MYRMLGLGEAVSGEPWWRCPNTPPCPHGGVFHDVEDFDRPDPEVLRGRLRVRIQPAQPAAPTRDWRHTLTQPEPFTPMIESAASLHEFFSSLVAAGFSEGQACRIVGVLLAEGSRSS